MRLFKNGKNKYAFIVCLLTVLFLMLSLGGCANETDVQDAEVNQSVIKDTVTLVACSDYQNPNGNNAGRMLVKKILKSIKEAGYENIDGFLCAGDYDHEYEETTEGIQSLKQAVQEVYDNVDEDKMIFVQGNHDMAFSQGLSEDGDNDTPGYGVYVIHEDDYPSDGGYIGGIERVADNLKDYLQEKLESNNKRPVFVISHVPLHYSMRTKKEGVSLYAKYIFEVLNQYAKEGQNIIYLYGHNHNTWGYDDYLGGSSVYLTEGDTIYIPQAGKSDEVPNAYEIQFTYMNAGYVGYSASANTGADKTLTMTVFRIEGENVTIERFSAYGTCNLKAKGVWSEYSGETALMYGAEDTYLEKEYASPQYVPSR